MISEEINGIFFKFNTNSQVFSPTSIDRGTKAMLSKADIREGDKLLDLGCGYGIVGIIAAKKIGAEHVVMCDISEEAVQLSRENAYLNGLEAITVLKSDGFDEITENDFTIILSNPPYHTDFSVAKHFIEQGFRHLTPGGRFFMVTKRREWYKNKIIATFGGVHIDEVDDYFVFYAEKRLLKQNSVNNSNLELKNKEKASKLSKKLERKAKRHR